MSSRGYEIVGVVSEVHHQGLADRRLARVEPDLNQAQSLADVKTMNFRHSKIVCTIGPASRSPVK